MMHNRRTGKKEMMIQEVNYTGTSFIFSWHINCFFHDELRFFADRLSVYGPDTENVESFLQNTPEREARSERCEGSLIQSTF